MSPPELDAALPVHEEQAQKPLPATRVLSCRDDDSPDSNSHYYGVDRMTRKLRDYPSLAKFAGLDSVSNCEEAKAYVRAYDTYAEEHPDFERRPDPLASANRQATNRNAILPRLKIMDTRFPNGAAQLTSWDGADFSEPPKVMGPIVLLRHVSWLTNDMTACFENAAGVLIDEFCEPAASCTGTFINRNMILTAAHCLQDTNRASVRSNPAYPWKSNPYCLNGDAGQPLRPGQSGKEAPFGMTHWIIAWPSGSPAYSAAIATNPNPGHGLTVETIGIVAYQFPHPKYDPTEEDSKKLRDIALLYIPPFDPASEGYLPPDPAGGSAVYLKSPRGGPDRASSSFKIAGWGRNPFNPDIKKLYGADAPSPLTWSTTGYGTFGRVKGVFPANGRGTAICSGDSGGPLYVDMTQNIAGPGITPRILEYAIAQGMTYRPEPTNGCPAPGDNMYWLRLEKDDDVIDWIKETMVRAYAIDASNPDAYSNICKEEADAQFGDYFRCWGDPCGKGLPACPAGTTCVHDGSTMLEGHQCFVCPGYEGTVLSCNCIVGECMWDRAKPGP